MNNQPVNSEATGEPRIDRWLSLIGIGEDGWDGLTAAARKAVQSADLLYGGTRHLAHIPTGSSARIEWPSPMATAVEEILTHHRRRLKIAVLATGDPMLYGVGVTLTRTLDPIEFLVIPQVSALSLACARLGWPVAEVSLISVVSRPLEQLYRYLAPGQRLVLYSEDGTTPATVARMLREHGYGPSRLVVFERLGSPSERCWERTAAAWSQPDCGPLNLIALACIAERGTQPLSLVPGLPDDAFETDGQLTKREIRAATLARLAPLPGQRLWDVGAGTGTIGIEWMRVHPSCSCIAFEEREDRATRIMTNAKQLGVPSLKVVRGSTPAAFEGLDAPDAIFIGGGISGEGLFAACWHKLPSGGRLVANAVTIESEANLASWQRLYGGDLSRISVARAEKMGDTLGWRSLAPVTQWSVTKP